MSGQSGSKGRSSSLVPSPHRWYHASKSVRSLHLSRLTSQRSFGTGANTWKVTSFPTLSHLNDDCLIKLLARVPFTDQILNIPLTCRRWNDLQPPVANERGSLVIRPADWNITDGMYPFTSPYLLDVSLPVSASLYTDYLNALITKRQADCTPVYASTDNYLLANDNLTRPIASKIVGSFSNLKHISLWEIFITAETLAHLLDHFQSKLVSLFLKVEILPVPSKTDQSLGPSIWPLINGMNCLRQLGLCFNYHSFARLAPANLSELLSSVLSQLVEFQIVDYKPLPLPGSNLQYNVWPLLKQLGEYALKRLTIWCCAWPHNDMLTRLVTEKPALSFSLTHLCLSHDGAPGVETYHVDEPLLRQVVKLFPSLTYLYLFSDLPLSRLIPSLSKLSSLVTFALTPNLETDDDYLRPLDYADDDDARFINEASLFLDDGLLDLTGRQLLAYQMPSLRVLRLNLVRLENGSFSLLPLLFPCLHQLALEYVYIQCDCSLLEAPEARVRYFRLPLHETNRPPGCTCLTRLVDLLNKLMHTLPKVTLP